MKYLMIQKYEIGESSVRQGRKMTKRSSLFKVMRCLRVSKLTHTHSDHPAAHVKWTKRKKRKEQTQRINIKVFIRRKGKTCRSKLKKIHYAGKTRDHVLSKYRNTICFVIKVY